MSFFFKMSDSSETMEKSFISSSSRSISYKTTVNKGNLSDIYDILKSKFEDLPALEDNMLFYEKSGADYSLKIKITHNKLIIKYKSKQEEETGIEEKLDIIKSKIDSI